MAWATATSRMKERGEIRTYPGRVTPVSAVPRVGCRANWPWNV